MATGREKPRKRKRKSGPDDPAQFKRFVEAAKKLGVDESRETFEKTFDKLIKPKRGSS